MATSGSTNYSETEAGIIRDAYIGIGAIDPTDSGVEAEQYEYASRVLNRLIKSWQKRGYNLWRTEEGSVTLVAAQAAYTMGGAGSPDFAARPVRISEVRYRSSSSIDLPMTEIAREDYFQLPNKASTGTPTNWYYDPSRSQGTLYVWPVPTTTTANTLRFTYQRAFEDFDENSDEPDLPQEWYDAIVKSLGAELCPGIFPTEPGLTQLHSQRATEAVETALMFDRETAPLRFMHDGAGY